MLMLLMVMLVVMMLLVMTKLQIFRLIAEQIDFLARARFFYLSIATQFQRGPCLHFFSLAAKVVANWFNCKRN